MGPGVDPHLYKPSAGDIRKLEDADIIFYNGLELEGRMTDLLVKIARAGKPTVPVSENISPDLLREPPQFQGKYDPHIWFDVTLWQQAAQRVKDELSAFDPGSEATYRANLDAYLAQLDELNQYARDQMQSIPEAQRVLITAHDAFGYFGEQYGIEVRGLQGTSTATEATAADIQALAELIAERKIPATIAAVQAAGSVAIFGRPYDEQRNLVGYVPQRGSVDWDFPTNALDVVMMGTYGRLGWVRRPGKAQREIAMHCLDQLGMADFANRQISQLSGGQQRVFLARALAQDAELYFMDEPFVGVDATTEQAIVDLLRELRAPGKTVVCVHHDLESAPDYFDWLVLLNVRLIASGPFKETFIAENLAKTYGGRTSLLPRLVEEADLARHGGETEARR